MLQSINALVTRISAEYKCARSGLGPLRLSGGQIFILFLQKTLINLVNKWNNASTTARITSSVLFVLVFTNVVERVQGYLTSLSRRGFPVLERPKHCDKWDWKAKAKEGAEKFPDSPYLVHYNGIEQIVYPSSSLGEIKALPLHEASLMEYSTHCLFEGWPFLGHEIGALYGAVGVDLARSLPHRISDRQAVTEQAFGKFIGECKEWKSIRLYPSVQRLVGRISGTGLLGPELGGSSQWLGTFDIFIYSVVFAMFSVSPIPKVFRPLLKYICFGPSYLMYWRLKNLAWPIAERDFRTYHASTAAEKSKPKHTARLGVWLATRYRDEERSIDKIAHDFIVTMFESLPSTTVTLYFVLSELAIRPELAEELRKEVMDSLVDGKLPASNLAELRKMDSFMREVTRTNIFSYLAVFRRVMKPIQPSIGPTVPAGAVICVDAYNIANSQEIWSNPETFDPMRFYNLRQQQGHENRHQFTSLDSDTAGWGGGRQACPGRFFAENTIKVFLSHLILNYEIKFPDGKGKPVVGTMPNGSVMPDMFAKIMIRERRKS